MKYKIKPFIEMDKLEYQTFITEVMNFSLPQMENILITMRKVLQKEIDIGSFSFEIVVVEYNLNSAKITQFDEVIGEESTIDLYTMLTEYLTILRCSKI